MENQSDKIVSLETKYNQTMTKLEELQDSFGVLADSVSSQKEEKAVKFPKD